RRVEGLKSILDALKPWRPPHSADNARDKGATGASGDGEDKERMANTASSEHGGKALIFVWALEQKASRRGWSEGDEQDVMVPWVMKGEKRGEKRGEKKEEETKRGGDLRSRQRGKGDVEQQEEMASSQNGSGVVADAGTAARRVRGLDVNGDEAAASPEDDSKLEGAGKTYYRYYHLYKRGELDEDVEVAGGKVLDGGWERDNWWVVAARHDGPR
ncbi:MAG: hypothetical protein LQ340_008065, partial [Diploschistes diacapsis]